LPLTDIDGIRTAYEVIGSGPPLLMLSPGGFNATMANWSTLGRYQWLRMVENLSTRFSCVIFDRRESGRSGGRLEVLGWDSYAAQAKGLLDHLGFASSHVLGGCAGCSVGLALARRHPASVRSLVLFSPAGGPRYRLSQQARFAVHLAFLAAEGPSAVVELANSSGASFSSDARVGPWAPPLRSDPGFAESYSRLEGGLHARIVAGSARTMFDRDTVPGAEPEELMTLQVPALIFPGDDDSHPPSAARYLQECLPRQTYVEVAVEEQGEELVRERTLSFLSRVDG
jgi:pimeloyl-ACP methyl ester carboxylesterase